MTVLRNYDVTVKTFVGGFVLRPIASDYRSFLIPAWRRCAPLAGLLIVIGPLAAWAQVEDRHVIRIAHKHLDGAPGDHIDPCAMEHEGAVLFLTEREIAELRVPFERLGSVREHSQRFRPSRTIAEVGIPSVSAMLGEEVRPRTGGRTAAGATNLTYDRYHDPEEGITFFQTLAAAYPHIARIQSIGQSVQGRDLWVLKLSDNPGANEAGEYSTFFCALHHAREWATHESILYIAEHLTEHYDDDWLVRHILDNSVVWVLLSANPDGFQISWEFDRLYRKNARGVDINRNYAYRWGFSSDGSSTNPSSGTYRGPSPASEPETQAIQNFLSATRPVIAVSFHTYSQLVLHPWGFTGLVTPESYTSLRALADGVAERIARHEGKIYLSGQSNYTLYATNGDFTDYAYGHLGILPYTIEQRPHSLDAGGFELPEDQLLSNARENLNASLWLMNLVASARTVAVPPALLTPGNNRFSLPVTPVSQKPELALGMGAAELGALSAYMSDLQFHHPPVVGTHPFNFEGLGAGSGYRFSHSGSTADWADSFESYDGLPYVFDEGGVVMLSNVTAGPNEIGIPGEEPVRLEDVSIYRRYMAATGNTFGFSEFVMEKRSAIQDLNHASPWINWNWRHIHPDSTEDVSHPLGAGGADLFVHPFRNYTFTVNVPSFSFKGTNSSNSVYLLKFPAPLRGDADASDAVDAADFSAFDECWTGPLRGPLSPECSLFDLDHDFDVDLDDLLVFQRHFGRVR